MSLLKIPVIEFYSDKNILVVKQIVKPNYEMYLGFD